ncbi:MAG: winged helix-turn-helix domain-containing protein [Pseudomonadota bacterium]
MNSNGQETRCFTVADLVVDTATQVVTRGDKQLELPPLSFRLLMVLADAAPAVVAHDQLVKQVWAGRVVSPETVTQRVKLLRQALGDDAQQPRYIGLVRGAGYRLMVEPQSAAAPGRPMIRRGPLFAAGGIIAAVLAVLFMTLARDGSSPQPAADHSLAVLAFDTAGVQAGSDWLGIGIPAEVAYHLSSQPGLRLIATSSSFAVRSDLADSRGVAARLGTRYLLRGSVTESDESVRVSVFLDDAHSRRPVWSRVYDRSFPLAPQVARSIANDVRVTLELGQPESGSPRSEAGPEAYVHLLRGRFFYDRRADGDIELAEAEYRKAVAADPQLARAWVGLAAIASVRFWQMGELDLATSHDVQYDALTRALSIDENLAEAHFRFARLLSEQGDTEVAERHRDRAIALAPDEPLMLIMQANRRSRAGDFEGAVQFSREALARDPLSRVFTSNLAFDLLFAGRTHEAAELIAITKSLSPFENFAFSDALILIQRTQYAAALIASESMVQRADREAIRAMALSGLGRQEEASRSIAALEALEAPLAIGRLAHVHARAGDAEAPFEALDALQSLCLRNLDRLADCRDALERVMALRFAPYLRGKHAHERWMRRQTEIRRSWLTARAASSET